jgi:predicted DNA-binding protein
MTNKKDSQSDKHVKISEDRHQKLKLLSVKTGKEMREIINEAFDLYIEKLNNK